MTQILDLPTIQAILKNLDPIPLMAEGFVAYSQGQAVVPPVGELLFQDPPGEVHIKYGYLLGDDIYVIKVASGFYRNQDLGLPSNSGLMLVFDQKNGSLRAILLDQGHLTDIRTAAAGAVAARYLKPSTVEAIGIFGTGIQARLQVQFLKDITPCRSVVVWGRSPARLEAYQTEMAACGFSVKTTLAASRVTAECNLIITTTAATHPLLHSNQIRPGTHITAMGSDTPEKNELDPQILAQADRVVADSISQCRERGEIHHALKQGLILETQLLELGQVILDPSQGRTSDQQITVADLTGVAVQDIQIAKAVLKARG